MKKALIAMSGGVDSSVAAARMVEDGYTCLGVTMRLHDYGNACGAATEAQDAATVAEELGFPFSVLDCREEFERHVIRQFVSAYEAGDTPNPCIECNRYLKFSLLYDYARQQGCDKVVTGHYARVEKNPETGKYQLKKAVNLQKDQSYVLYFLTQEQLAHIVFPLGTMPDKDTVRDRAAEYGFVSAGKKDSQDICFVPDGKYADFIRRRTGREYPPGDFVDMDGRVLGQHKGLIGYTIGQRKGLGVAAAHRLYVYDKDPEHNIVRLGGEERIFSREVAVENLNLIALDRIDAPLRCRARVRYHHAEQPCTVEQTGAHSLRVRFDEPQRAVVPGQSLVLYDGDYVLGGGVISGAANEQ